MKTKHLLLLIGLTLIVGIAVAQDTEISKAGNVKISSGQCTKEQIIWFKENYGGIHAKVYWDRYTELWMVGFYDDEGKLFEIPDFKGYYTLHVPREEDLKDKELSEAIRQDGAEYYTCVWIRRVYEKYANIELERPPILNIDMQLGNVK